MSKAESWQQTKHARLYHDAFQDQKKEPLIALLSQQGASLSASAVPHCWGGEEGSWGGGLRQGDRKSGVKRDDPWQEGPFI